MHAPASTVARDSAPAINSTSQPPNFSTGPKTQAGKAKSSQNALRHGAYAQSTLLPSESHFELIPFRIAWLETLSPQTAPELYFAERIVSLAWRLQRFTQAAADLHFYRQHPLNVGVENPHQTLTQTEDRLQSMLTRALKQFHQLQKARQDNPPPPPCPYLTNQSPTVVERDSSPHSPPDTTTTSAPEKSQNELPAPPRKVGCDSSHHSPPPESANAPAEEKAQNELPPSPSHDPAPISQAHSCCSGG